jgi:hypothetical protein
VLRCLRLVTKKPLVNQNQALVCRLDSFNQGARHMWLDLLVASGLGLPAMVYGSLLFVNYMQ